MEVSEEGEKMSLSFFWTTSLMLWESRSGFPLLREVEELFDREIRRELFGLAFFRKIYDRRLSLLIESEKESLRGECVDEGEHRKKSYLWLSCHISSQSAKL